MKKHGIQIIASEETYQNLQSFKDINELNHAVRAYKERFKDVLTKSALKVLDLLHRYSAKYTGVSFLLKNTIAKELGISRRTVIRACQLLAELGIVKQYEMKRQSDMLQTGNAIVIQPIVEPVTQETPELSHQENNTFSKTNNIKNNNKRNESVPSTENHENNFSKANFIAHWVPKTFAELTTCYYSDAKIIQEFWTVVRHQNRVVNHQTGQRAFSKDQEIEIGIRSFKELVMKIKSRKNIKNIFGYFNGIVDHLMDKLFFDEDFMQE